MIQCLNYFIIATALADVAIALIAAIGINLSAICGKPTCTVGRPSAVRGGQARWSSSRREVVKG